MRLARQNQGAWRAQARKIKTWLSEMEVAARWAMTHDVSDEFAMVLKHLLMSSDN